MTDAATATNLAATGKVLRTLDGTVVFNPAGTNYEMHLAAAKYDGPLNRPVKCLIRVVARKVYTVPSGGNFLTPLFGPPRMVQGLVKAADDRALVVQAGCPIHVSLPGDDDAIDLDQGPIAVGRMVNVVCEPGARVEFVKG